jgi:hypothetical protein
MTNEVLTCSLRQCSSSDWYTLPEEHRSPTGAWVKSITISDPSSAASLIHVQLLGAFRDGTIEFTYKEVQSYAIRARRDVAGHGDWLEDKLDVKRHDSLRHRVTLTNGSFEIEANEIEYKWTPLSAL